MCKLVSCLTGSMRATFYSSCSLSIGLGGQGLPSSISVAESLAILKLMMFHRCGCRYLILEEGVLRAKPVV